MAMAIDALAHKKLVLVKSLYQHALKEASAEHSITSRLLAVIEFDLALETALKAILGALDPNSNPSSDLNTLLQRCDNALSTHALAEVPQRANINAVRRTRNAAQHEARYPNPTELNDCRTYTRDALEAILALVWGANIEGIRMTQLVRHHAVKRYLDRAEAAFAAGDSMETATWAAAGLDHAMNRVERSTVGKPPPAPSPRLAMGETALRLTNATNIVVARMQRMLLYVTLGMNYGEYMRYQQIIGQVAFNGSGQAPFLIAPRMPMTISDAELVLSYAVDTVLRIEEVAGDLDQPYGNERW